MGLVYLPIYMKTMKIQPNVGQYTIPMDPMGHGHPVCFFRGFVLPVLTCWGSRHWEQHLGLKELESWKASPQQQVSSRPGNTRV